MNVPDDADRCGYIRNHVGPRISGPKCFTAVTSEDKMETVSFKAPADYVEKSNLGMKKKPKEKQDRRPVTLDSRRRYEVDIGRVAARQ